MEGQFSASLAAPKLAHRRRRLAIVAIVVVFTASAVIIGMILPYWTGAHEFPVRTIGSGTSIQVKVPYPSYVTVRFSQHSAVSMSYWVRGPGAMPGSGTMTMGAGGANYAFWSWGGTYSVGAGAPVWKCGVPCFTPVSGEVWANVTTGIL